MKKSVKVIFVSHIGLGSVHWNLRPDVWFVPYDQLRVSPFSKNCVQTFAEAIMAIRETGFRIKRSDDSPELWIPPSAIIELSEYQKGKS